MQRIKHLTVLVSATLALSACGNGDVATRAAASADKAPTSASTAAAKPLFAYDGTAAKPGAPFAVSYRIIGTPIVGSPVTIDLRIESMRGAQPITVDYRINDAAAMSLHEAQPARVQVEPVANENFIAQRVTVIPQREGRIYLNVSASFETAEGSTSTIMAVPIQVGTGGPELRENGEVRLDENGKAVRVLTQD
ncbi:MAG: hypothetical protein WBM87_02180 [Woeseiaceae bacterium]